MLNHSQWMRSGFVVALTLALLAASFAPRPHAQTQTDDRAGQQSEPRTAPSRRHGIEGLWSAEERDREMELWHELNRQRFVGVHPLGAEAVGAEAVVVDRDDISVIQDDGTLAMPENPFDLPGRRVEFWNFGDPGGYIVYCGVDAFDRNLGTKLDLTAWPAYNPGGSTEPGDNAYIMQDLGFDFPFYDRYYRYVYVTSNGNLTFRPSGASDEFFNANSIDPSESLSDLQTKLPRIAPYWHDLDARAGATQGGGIYFRRGVENGRRHVLVTWYNIRDFPNDPSVDRGKHSFQVKLIEDGSIYFTYDSFTYDSPQLTSTALAGLSPGSSTTIPNLVDLYNGSAAHLLNGPIAEFFTTKTRVDLVGIARAFYLAHPNQDIYDFVYFMTDFDFDLGPGAFAFYRGLSNDATGIGKEAFNNSNLKQIIGSNRIQGILNLNNIVTAYPSLPSERLANVSSTVGGANKALAAYDALSIFAHEQGHRWLAYIRYPALNPNLLLGNANSHWSFFLNTESTISGAAARRSSSMEGNVWRENGDETFTTVSLVDGYSLLDQYLMGLRPPGDMPDTFVITNPTGANKTPIFPPEPNVTVRGAKQTTTINQILQANGARSPDASAAPKDFRAAVILLVRQGTQPSAAKLNKVTRYRLAWESYFAQSTDYIAGINTGLADQTVSRVIAAASAASYKATLAPGEITALFGNGLTAGGTEAATSQPLPTTLAGTRVLINGAPAPLFFASPRQINFQVPSDTPATTNNPFTEDVPSGAVTIEVIRDGQLIRAGVFQIAPAVPAIFTRNQSGSGPAAAVDAFTGAQEPFNAKQANGKPNIIAVFGTGLGGDATDVDGNVSESVRATVGGKPAKVLYAGRTPGFTGLNQLNIELPDGITSGTHEMVVRRNDVPSNPTTIAIK
jgi:uncharacterized protein (TIGR03437 family)